VGNPAKIVGWRCEYGHQLTFNEDDAICLACKKQYIKDKEKVSPVDDNGMKVKLWVAG
jgi:hypothetical protein